MRHVQHVDSDGDPLWLGPTHWSPAVVRLHRGWRVGRACARCAQLRARPGAPRSPGRRVDGDGDLLVWLRLPARSGLLHARRHVGHSLWKITVDHDGAVGDLWTFVDPAQRKAFIYF